MQHYVYQYPMESRSVLTISPEEEMIVTGPNDVFLL